MAAKKRAEATRKPPKKVAQKRPRRPTLRLTCNGQVVGIIIGPRGANDVHIMFGIPILDGGGYFTKNGKEIPKTRFIFGPDINDFHFSPSGRFGKGGVPLKPPPSANDIEIESEGDFIFEAWWTRDGKRIEEIPIEPGSTDISVDWS